MTSLPGGDLNERWVRFSTTKSPETYYDYFVTMYIRQLFVTPDLQLLPGAYTDKKTVQDGYENEPDGKDNVNKDSLGNDIRKPKHKTITCVVTDYIQQKSVAIAITIDFKKGTDPDLLSSYPPGVNHDL